MEAHTHIERGVPSNNSLLFHWSKCHGKTSIDSQTISLVHQSVEKMKTIRKSHICKTYLREITAQTTKLYRRNVKDQFILCMKEQFEIIRSKIHFCKEDTQLLKGDFENTQRQH